MVLAADEPVMVIPLVTAGAVDILEVRDRGEVAGGLVGVAQVDRCRRLQDQRIGARCRHRWSIRSRNS